MKTETEQIKVLLARADHALSEYDRYSQQAAEMARQCVLPFLRDTSKCRVEYGELDWHHVHILSEEAWAELLTLFRGYTKSRCTIPLDTQMSGACLEFKDNEVSLYMKTMTLDDHKIPVDVGPRLERFRKQREEFLKINAAQAEKFTNLPGAYVHKEEETGK